MCCWNVGLCTGRAKFKPRHRDLGNGKRSGLIKLCQSCAIWCLISRERRIQWGKKSPRIEQFGAQHKRAPIDCGPQQVEGSAPRDREQNGSIGRDVFQHNFRRCRLIRPRFEMSKISNTFGDIRKQSKFPKIVLIFIWSYLKRCFKMNDTS